MLKFSVNTPSYMVSLLFFITYDNYTGTWLFKIIQGSALEQYFLCRNWEGTKIIDISFNMTLLIVRNHYSITYSKVLENRAKTGAPFISAYKYFDFHFTLKRQLFFSFFFHSAHPLGYATAKFSLQNKVKAMSISVIDIS